MARRKSLDAVKAEMREGNMRTVQAPSKVQDRVRQWQKNGAAIAIEDPNMDEIIVTLESDSDEGPNEADRLRIKHKNERKSKSPVPVERSGRRKVQDGPAKGHEDDEERRRSKSAAPKKRVISDSHWMKKKKGPPRKGTGIPKNFLQATAINPPVERKIEDWVKRTTETTPTPKKIAMPRRKEKSFEREDSPDRTPRKSSRQRSPYDDNIRVRGSGDDGIRIKPSKSRPEEDSSWVTSSRGGSSNDDGIRTKPLKLDQHDDGIRIRPSREAPVDEKVYVKEIRKDGSKRRPKDGNDSPTPNPRKSSERHLKPPTESEIRSRTASYTASQQEEDDKFSQRSPSPPEKSKRKSRKSDTMTATESLDEIPFGDSAFSVLELPLGAEAGTLKRPAPKRNPSFGVPKVLKRVYNEVMHDNHEPVRGGPNKPPSIDSWLNATSDPFVDGQAPTESESPLGGPSSPPSRMPSHEDEDRTERALSSVHKIDRSTSRRYQERSKSPEESPITNLPNKTRDTPPALENSPPISPGGLKRTPATHKISSPKSGERLFSKEAIFDAFKGDSSMGRGKNAEPSPFDFIGLRERDLNRVHDPEPTSSQDFTTVSEKPQRKVSPVARKPSLGHPKAKDMPAFPRRPGPTTGGGHRLSTIASVETFSTSSSRTATESELSQTTVTQSTDITAPTSSSLSRSSVKPSRKRSKPKTLERSQIGSKRGLVKHSDLVSMLSLPDTTQPGQPNSVRPARSMRTMRVHLETATIQDIMREVAEDEKKYTQELNTLVDGVIPVLLTCVLSKNDSVIAAGLLNPTAPSTDNSSFTKPIVDMGIALERLKSLHRRIPLTDANAFLSWAQTAHKTYEDYLIAWRTGFQDVVVNLEPVSPSGTPQKSDSEMKRDKNGDIIRDNGERADVAYLLKRPLVRVKYLARATKVLFLLSIKIFLFSNIEQGLDRNKQTSLSTKMNTSWENLEAFCRKRAREEAARREDLDAAMTDTTRARDPSTLAPLEGVVIDRSLQVSGKDTFSLDLQHSSGQRMECEVEIILRDQPSNAKSGDILICGFDGTHRFLLFPPISKNSCSARKGVNESQLVIMIRSSDEKKPWQEPLVLGADDLEAAQFWIKELGATPLVPEVHSIQNAAVVYASPNMATIVEESDSASVLSLAVTSVPDDVPIGERRRREEERTRAPSPNRYRSYRRRGPVTNAHERLGEEKLRRITEMNVIDFRELNELMVQAGYAVVKKLKPRGTSPTKRVTPSRYHNRKDEASTEVAPIDITGDKSFVVEMSGALDPYPENFIEKQEAYEEVVDHRAGSPDYSRYDSMDLPYIPKKRASSSSSVPGKTTTPLKESMRPELQSQQKPQSNTPTLNEAPPPVPTHRTISSPELKNIPLIDTPTQRNKNRRGSSPLKHEYQPSESDASGTSSCEDSDSLSNTSGSYSDSSDDELEAIDEEDEEVSFALPRANSQGKKRSPNDSLYSFANDSLAPSNSASQGPYIPRVPSNGTIVDPLAEDVRKFAATVSFWNGSKGKWEDLFERPDQPCSIVVSAGLIEAFEIDAEHASPKRNLDRHDEREPPMIALGLTPHVPLRQSTVIDIEVTSPPLVSSRFKKSSTIRFRASTSLECKAMYEAIHRARMNNPAWKKLEQDRMLAAYGNGNQAYEAAVASSRRSRFGRKKSYRASTRAPSETISEQSSNSALSALRRMGGAGIFNIAKSSVQHARGGTSTPSSGPTSMYTTGSSDYSGATTPKSPSIAASGSMYSNGLAVRNIGSDNLKIRLYRGATSSKWQDMGEARLSVTSPPPSMRHASSLNHGIPKRITVVQAQREDDLPIDLQEDPAGSSKRRSDAVVWLDVVLGSRNFMKYGRNGIAFEIWEDIKGDDGVVGGIPAVGGASGRSRKWMFQTQRTGDCLWILGLVGGYEA